MEDIQDFKITLLQPRCSICGKFTRDDGAAHVCACGYESIYRLTGIDKDAVTRLMKLADASP